jgi:hexosaminidase
MRKLVALFIMLCPMLGISQNVIPQPSSIVARDEAFDLKTPTNITYNNKSLIKQVSYLNNQIFKLTNITLHQVNGAHQGIIIALKKQATQAPLGSYNLLVSGRKIVLTAGSREGIFYGMQSLLQLIKKDNTIPAVTITDEPRYQWRGFMLDESRHFFGKEKVKDLLNWMTRYKLNKFHWHLTDSHGWRLQIKKYPKLTTAGGIGNFTDSTAAAQYYTQADIREIVAYARERFIDVIPEIDMPGHAAAANKAYPQFNGGSVAGYPNFTFDPSQDRTYQYLSNIIRETNTLFPSKMIHLGGDEVFLGIQAWLNKPQITTMMAKKNFKTPTDLEHYFFRRMADTVISLGSKILCWDEAVETDLPANNTIVFWWRQNKPQQLKRALEKNYQVVLSPRLPMYFDFVQDSTHISGRKWDSTTVAGYQLQNRFNSYLNVYNFPDAFLDKGQLSSKNIIGVQANLWTETVGTGKRLDYLIFPRMAALAEAGWASKKNKNPETFNQKLKAELEVYKRSGLYYYNPFNPDEHPEVVDFAPRAVKD